MLRGRFSPTTGLVGVDIAHRSVKLLQVQEQSDGLSVVGAAMIDLDRDGGEINPVGFGQRLKTAIAAGGFAGRQCVVSLPRAESLVQSARLPAMPDAELRQAVVWEAAQRFGADHTTLQADFIRTGATLQGGENREEVLVIAANRDAVSIWLEGVLHAGLRPVAVETGFTAVARTFTRQCRREADRDQVRVVLEIGAGGSTVLILRGDQIAFCKALPIGGSQFNQALAEHLQMDVEAARELRTARLCQASGVRPDETTDPATDRAVYEAVRPLMGDLVKEVTLCMRYYGVTFRGHPPSRIILTGGEALEPHLDELLEQSCKVPCAIDDEVGTLERLGGQIRAKLGRLPGPAPCWSVAAGLSLRPTRRRNYSRSAPVRREAA